jgi:hypothetical protein
MSNYLSEKSVKKYNDDMLMFEYLLGELFVSTDISFDRESPRLKIQGLNFTIRICYEYSKSHDMHITYIYFYQQNYKICFRHKYETLHRQQFSDPDHERIVEPYIISLSQNNQFYGQDFVTINELNNGIKNKNKKVLNKIYYNLKSIDIDLPQKYALLIEYCFDFMGG